MPTKNETATVDLSQVNIRVFALPAGAGGTLRQRAHLEVGVLFTRTGESGLFEEPPLVYKIDDTGPSVPGARKLVADVGLSQSSVDGLWTSLAGTVTDAIAQNGYT